VFAYSGVKYVLTIWVTEVGTAYPSRAPGVRVASLYSLHFCVCLSPTCVLCPILPVSLDCSFLISPSIFSNVYLHVHACLMLVIWLHEHTIIFKMHALY